MAVFRVVADGAQQGSTSKASPSRLTMHVPLAALPSPVASDITLRIPKAHLSCHVFDGMAVASSARHGLSKPRTAGFDSARSTDQQCQ
jgi:hypothetical protein